MRFFTCFEKWHIKRFMYIWGVSRWSVWDSYYPKHSRNLACRTCFHLYTIQTRFHMLHLNVCVGGDVQIYIVSYGSFLQFQLKILVNWLEDIHTYNLKFCALHVMVILVKLVFEVSGGGLFSVGKVLSCVIGILVCCWLLALMWYGSQFTLC